MRRLVLALQLEHRNLAGARCRALALALTANATFALAIFEASEEKRPYDSDNSDNCDKNPDIVRNHFVDLQPERPVTPGGAGWSGEQDAKHYGLQQTERRNRNFF